MLNKLACKAFYWNLCSNNIIDRWHYFLVIFCTILGPRWCLRGCRLPGRRRCALRRRRRSSSQTKETRPKKESQRRTSSGKSSSRNIYFLIKNIAFIAYYKLQYYNPSMPLITLSVKLKSDTTNGFPPTQWFTIDKFQTEFCVMLRH